jgi:orotidine-5'-phosphate decarboxylase
METLTPTTLTNPLCVALDTADLERALALVREVGDAAGMVKVGMEMFYAHGAVGYAAIAAEGVPVFLDLKLHDIPNTVHAALVSLMRLDPPPAVIDVHATGGPAMMQAASRAVRGRSKVIAVTVLTSLADEDLAEVGFDPARPAEALAVSLARLAQDCGLDGVVCSPVDLAAIRSACGADFLTVVPGLRPSDTDAGDQKRIATPAQAWAAGADILVIGRPITAAPDPAGVARQILASLEKRP